jgi:hypothetical protein
MRERTLSNTSMVHGKPQTRMTKMIEYKAMLKGTHVI